MMQLFIGFGYVLCICTVFQWSVHLHFICVLSISVGRRTYPVAGVLLFVLHVYYVIAHREPKKKNRGAFNFYEGLLLLSEPSSTTVWLCFCTIHFWFFFFFLNAGCGEEEREEKGPVLQVDIMRNHAMQDSLWSRHVIISLYTFRCVYLIRKLEPICFHLL